MIICCSKKFSIKRYFKKLLFSVLTTSLKYLIKTLQNMFFKIKMNERNYLLTNNFLNFLTLPQTQHDLKIIVAKAQVIPSITSTMHKACVLLVRDLLQ